MEYAIGIDLGGTSIKYALVDKAPVQATDYRNDLNGRSGSIVKQSSKPRG